MTLDGNERSRSFFRTPLLLFLLVLAVYAATLRDFDPSRPIPFHHQAVQADAFLHGRLDIQDYPPHEELAHYNGKAYLAAPPGPALVLLPFVAVAGPHVNPVPLQLFLSSISAALLYAVFRARGVGQWRAVIATIAIAFGTVLWWCTRHPGHWFSAHVISFFFLAAALWMVHVHPRPVLVGLLLGASALCRQLTLFAFPFFLYRLMQTPEPTSLRGRVWKAFFFFGGLAIPMLGYLAFNYARFGNPLDAGYNHLYLGSPGLERYNQFGLFDLHYLPENLYTVLFAAPLFSTKFPYLAPEYAGQAILFTSPFLLYAFRFGFKNREHLVVWGCILMILVPQLLYFNNGFRQFGYRFALDFIPLIALLAADGMPARPHAGLITVVGLSIFLNAVGVYRL